MIIMPNQLPRPSVDNPLPWKAIPHTDNFGGTVVAKSGHVVTELDRSEDAEFVAASASAFYNLFERNERLREENETLNNVAANLQRSRASLIDDNARLRDLVRRLAQILQNTYDFAEALRAIVPVSPEQERTRDAAQAVLAAIIREARVAIGEDKE